MDPFMIVVDIAWQAISTTIMAGRIHEPA